MSSHLFLTDHKSEQVAKCIYEYYSLWLLYLTLGKMIEMHLNKSRWGSGNSDGGQGFLIGKKPQDIPVSSKGDGVNSSHSQQGRAHSFVEAPGLQSKLGFSSMGLWSVSVPHHFEWF